MNIKLFEVQTSKRYNSITIFFVRKLFEKSVWFVIISTGWIEQTRKTVFYYK